MCCGLAVGGGGRLDGAGWRGGWRSTSGGDSLVVVCGDGDSAAAATTTRRQRETDSDSKRLDEATRAIATGIDVTWRRGVGGGGCSAGILDSCSYFTCAGRSLCSCGRDRNIIRYGGGTRRRRRDVRGCDGWMGMERGGVGERKRESKKTILMQRARRREEQRGEARSCGAGECVWWRVWREVGGQWVGGQRAEGSGRWAVSNGGGGDGAGTAGRGLNACEGRSAEKTQAAAGRGRVGTEGQRGWPLAVAAGAARRGGRQAEAVAVWRRRMAPHRRGAVKAGWLAA